MNDWAVIIVIYLALFISSPLIAIFHELGHALAYLVFTKPDKIDIYIGSYQLPKNPIQFKAGKLNFYIKRSFPFVKGIGLCKSYKAEEDYQKYIVILLAGVFFTFFTAGILALIVFNANAPLLVQIACYIFLGLSTLSLLTNLIPREIDNSSHTNLNSDGKQLVLAVMIKRARVDYIGALEHIDKKEYDAAIVKLKLVLKKAPKAKEVLRLLTVVAIEARQFDEAAKAIAALEKKTELMLHDLFYKGCLQSLTGQHDEAIVTYSNVLKKDKNHLLALTNVGYELIEKGAHQVAKRALDKAIKLKPGFDQPYSNLGYSKILQDELDEGKLLVDKCLELNINNADAYKSLGIYYLKLRDINLANKNFNKAIELDATIDLGAYADKLKLLADQRAPTE